MRTRHARFLFPVSVGLLVLFAYLPWIGEALRAVLLALAAAIGVATTMKLVRRLTGKVIDAIRPPTSAGLEISPNLKRFGLSGIYCTRSETQAADVELWSEAAQLAKSIRTAILDQAKRGRGHIILVGVSLRDFFHPNGANAEFIRELYETLRQRNNQAQLSIAVLDPDGNEAHRREILEGTGQTINDIQNTINRFKERFSTLPGCKLFLYEVRPPMFAVFTEGFACEQRYLIAPSRERKTGVCFGDTTPILTYRANTVYHEQLYSELLEFLNTDVKLL